MTGIGPSSAIAQIMRVGWFKAVHVKSPGARSGPVVLHRMWRDGTEFGWQAQLKAAA